MHRTPFRLAAVALVVMACESAPTAPEQPATTLSLARGGEPPDGRPDHQNTRIPFTWTLTNPCLPVPETVVAEGYSHYNAHFKFFEGGNSSRLMSNNYASGVGLITGLKYQFHQLWRLDGTFTYVDNRWETEQMTRYHLISQTDHGNFFSTVRTKVVVTPTGITTEVISTETDCRG